jgi:hypothetical protein
MKSVSPETALILASSDPSTARQALEAACAASGRRDHRGWAAVADVLGLHGLAFQEWLLAARAAPQDPALLARVAELYRERGDARRAAAALERAVALPSAPAEAWRTLGELYAEERQWDRVRELSVRAEKAKVDERTVRALDALVPRKPEPAESESGAETLVGASDADLVRLLGLFGGRAEVHARQWYDPRKGQGGYSPVQQPLTVRELRSHLAGDVTLGVYPIRLDGTVGFFALDLDITRRALDAARSDVEQARALRRKAAAYALELLGRLRALGFEPLLESSGYKGRHVWVFLDPPQPATRIHRLGELLAKRIAADVPPELHVEVFPKQGKRSGDKGLGNLIKLPLGVHRVSGRRSLLLDAEGQPVHEPFELLHGFGRAGTAQVDAALLALRDGAAEAEAPPGGTLDEAEERAQAEQAAEPLPALPPMASAPPAWTSADFRTRRDLAHLMAHCPVLDRLRAQAEDERRLGYDEQMVLVHTLGHLPHGLLAANYLLARVPEVPKERFLKSRLQGNPMSCPKIRARISHITSELACNCVFPLAPEHYPTPQLHLLDLPPEPEPQAQPARPAPEGAVPLEKLGHDFRVLQRRAAEIEQELTALSRALAARLRIEPDLAVGLPGGKLELGDEEGVEAIRWVPAGGAGEAV